MTRDIEERARTAEHMAFSAVKLRVRRIRLEIDKLCAELNMEYGPYPDNPYYKGVRDGLREAQAIVNQQE